MKKKKSKIMQKQEVFQLSKGLSWSEAWELVRHKCKHDHRGFTYSTKTGKAVAT